MRCVSWAFGMVVILNRGKADTGKGGLRAPRVAGGAPVKFIDVAPRMTTSPLDSAWGFLPKLAHKIVDVPTRPEGHLVLRVALLQEPEAFVAIIAANLAGQ